MSIDPAAVSAALFARVKSDSAGAAVRALLGAGAASVISARDLPKEPGKVGTLPARPLLAWREGPIGGQAGEMETFTGAWWVYDEPGQGDRRINAIVAALKAAHRDQVGIVDYGRVRVGPVGQAALDRVIGLYGRAVQITYRAL